MKTVAIIPAGGAGLRLGSSIAKQYLLLDGVPVLARTIKIFQQAKIINDIILADVYSGALNGYAVIVVSGNCILHKFRSGGLNQQTGIFIILNGVFFN